MSVVLELADRLAGAWASSATETGASLGATVSSRFTRGSRTVEITHRLAETGRRAVANATITGFARWTEGAIRSAWLYRRLTAEPEPEVIVIDLRETVSVGPVIAILDQVIRWLVPASHRSTVVGAAERVLDSVRNAPVRATSLFLTAVVLSNLVGTLVTGQATRVGFIIRIGLLGLAVLGTRVTVSWNDLVETRVVQLLIAALEPPEPPENGSP